MLKVLTLATLFPDASRPNFGLFVERQTLELAARPDVELQVVAPIGIPPWPASLLGRYRPFEAVPRRESWKGLTVHRPRFPLIPKVGGRFTPALMARAVRPLLREIRARFAFDVIDAEFFYPDGPAAMRLARALGVPFSVKARGSDIHHWSGVPGCRDQIVAAGQAAAGMLAVSAALKRDMAALGLPAERIAVHYTGVDRERFRPVDRREAKRALGIEGPLVVSVGALIARKGQALVVEALAAIPGASLVLVGDGPERAALQAQAARLGIADRVRLTGALPPDEVAMLLAAADAMALPSQSEGLANAWVEALASGTPIVIADVGGARELLDRTEAGALVPHDPAAIAQAIRAILAAPPDREAVRATVDRFSWQRNAEALFAHLSAAAGRAAG